MLMDIECGRGPHEEIKKEKQSKPKKTNGQKRIIANRIALGCLAAAFISVIPGLIARHNYDKDIKELTDDQNAIYEQFMDSDTFSDSFKAEFTKVSNDYANGVISYEEFDEKVQYLNSYENARKVLDSSNSELKTQVEKIDQQKETRAEKFGSNPIVDLSLGGLVVGGTVAIASIMATDVYDVKISSEEKRKAKENNTSGIKYYDSTTMTIRNSNTNEQNEDTLTK